ncbi:homeodomain-interacting protein kinase 2-like [Lycodopsis pacificus]
MSQNEMNEFQLKKYDILCNKSVQYRVLDFIGEGGFGKVAKCINLDTFDVVAIKINKEWFDHVEEVKRLKQLKTLDPEENNLVRFEGSFIFKGMYCIAFQMLDRSLVDLLNERRGPLSLNEIRPIARQLLVAFKALKGIDLLHTDLKPDNVMLVNHQDEPFKVKLIDFGLAIPASEARKGMIMQPCGFRAPEVSLGLPISEAIDMWSLGCLLTTLFFCHVPFADDSPYNVMKTVCHLLGQPEDHLLNAGMYTSQYFKRDYCSSNSRWRLKTAKEYMEESGIQTISEFEIDLGCGAEDLALHFNPRFHDDTDGAVLVCNSKAAGCWADEKREIHNPLQRGAEVKMVLKLTGDMFEVELPDGHEVQFPNRNNMDIISCIKITGDFKLTSLKIC